MNLRTPARILALGALLTALPAAAQPDPTNQTKADNPPVREKNRDKRQQLDREQRLRLAMEGAGVTDKDAVAAAVSHAQDQDAARLPLQRLAANLASALNEETLTEAQLGTLLASFKAAQEADEKRRREAEAALEARIKYSRSPRLESALLVLGVIGQPSFRPAVPAPKVKKPR